MAEHTYWLLHMFDLANSTRWVGGGTLDIRTLTMADKERGFWVGGVERTVEIPEPDFSEYSLREAVETFQSPRYVGTWLSNGIVYVDSVEWVADASEALRIAGERGEEAVYDIAGNTELMV